MNKNKYGLVALLLAAVAFLTEISVLPLPIAMINLLFAPAFVFFAALWIYSIVAISKATNQKAAQNTKPKKFEAIGQLIYTIIGVYLVMALLLTFIAPLFTLGGPPTPYLSEIKGSLSTIVIQLVVLVLVIWRFYISRKNLKRN